MRPQRLRIESLHGSPVNDYRIHDGHVELRLLKPSGRPHPPPLSDWKALDESDIESHFALETVVSKWLEARLDQEESKVATFQIYHTEERIPTSGIYRVYHKVHRLPDEVALLEGCRFPRCSKCSEKVTFRMMKAAAKEGLEQRHAIVLHECRSCSNLKRLKVLRARRLSKMAYRTSTFASQLEGYTGVDGDDPRTLGL